MPTLRVMVAKELIDGRGMRPSEVAARMEMTPAAITQYMKGVRGKCPTVNFEKSAAMMEVVAEVVDELAKKEVDQSRVASKLCDACGVVGSEKIVPEMSDEARRMLLACRRHSSAHAVY